MRVSNREIKGAQASYFWVDLILTRGDLSLSLSLSRMHCFGRQKFNERDQVNEGMIGKFSLKPYVKDPVTFRSLNQ
jgi:hypothetical protein